MNTLFRASAENNEIQPELAMREINALIKWQMARKRWHQDKTRQKMAAETDLDANNPASGIGGDNNHPGFSLRSSDFGINEQDLAELDLNNDSLSDDASDIEEEEDELDTGADPLEAEQKRRAKQRERLRRAAGEPVKPDVEEVTKLMPGFLGMLRNVLAE